MNEHQKLRNIKSTECESYPSIMWFRQDLRISDNPALFEAARKGMIIPVYIFYDELIADFKMGEASKWWLYNSLNSLNKSLGGKLNIYKGDPKSILPILAKEHKVKQVYWNRRYESEEINLDLAVRNVLQSVNVECVSFCGSLLWEPTEVLKNDQKPYQVFTYFYRNGCLNAKEPRTPLPKPDKSPFLKLPNNAISIEDLDLLSKTKWHEKLEKHWIIGEDAAQAKLTYFMVNNLKGYKETRNYPSKASGSKLSPHLHFGEISPNQIWYAIHAKFFPESLDEDASHFLSEIAWREFSYYMLYHFPELPCKNFQSKFDNFPWQQDEALLDAWKMGSTGYPIIDAGMRELWKTGGMHNRVRMIVGSFLTKNLLLDWRRGEAWFRDCLVDADIASNSASWQWIAGSGADAAPYFRVFNPVLQGEKFDVNGEYTRRFVPELAKLPDKFLFKPWEAPENILNTAGITLGKDYPYPIVNLAYSRNRALESYGQLSKAAQPLVG